MTRLGMAMVLVAVVLAMTAEARQPPGRVGTPVQLGLLFGGLLLVFAGLYSFLSSLA